MAMPRNLLMPRSLLIAATVAMAGGAASAQSLERSPVINLALGAFTQACASHLGHPADAEDVVKALGFTPADPAAAARFSQDGSRNVWLYPQPGMGVAVLTAKDGLACSVYVQRGDTTRLQIRFIAAMEGMARPTTTVKRADDAITGSAANLAYRVHSASQPAGSPDRAFRIIVNASPQAGVAAILTAAAVRSE